MFDVVVLGGGPGGYVAAIRAAQLGASVALVERDRVGGTCLNRGCIPTKALVASVELLARAQSARQLGLKITVDFDATAVMKRKDQVVNRLVKGVELLLGKNGIEVVKGTGTVNRPGEVVVGGRAIQARNIILATGSRPQVFPAFGYDGEVVMTSDEILRLQEIPSRLLIVGGGVIGCEFACIFNRLGAEVTMVELMPQILPNVDAEVARTLSVSLKRQGIRIHTSTRISEIRREGNRAVARMESGEMMEADRVLVSVGRVPETDAIAGLGLAQNRAGEVVVDERMATNLDGIYAVGDMAEGRYKLAHVASRQGVVAAENACGMSPRMDYRAVPNCIFTLPEVATVGLSTEEAASRGPVREGRFPFVANGKAVTMNETEGLVKVVADERSTILGVHIIGAHASDLIATATQLVHNRMTTEEAASAIFAHPTLSESLAEALEAVNGKAIHGL